VLKQWLQDILPKVFGSAGNFEVIVFGVMMVIVLQRARDGLWPLLAGLVPVRAAQAPSTAPRRAAEEAPAADGRDHPRSEGRDPQVRRPGGQQQHEPAVKAGEILALIGPNGAGKSTMFNQLGGYAHLGRGAVPRQVGGRPQLAEIAALGMSRTFQHVRLLPKMTVLENVAIGAHCAAARASPAAWRLDRDEEARLLRRPHPGGARRPQGLHVRRGRQPGPGPAAHPRDRPRPVSDPACCCSTSRPPACA
jgi:branched-chain amino acid transport system permease protein